jgi:Insecticidal Crystal Toxin, P42
MADPPPIPTFFEVSNLLPLPIFVYYLNDTGQKLRAGTGLDQNQNGDMVRIEASDEVEPRRAPATIPIPSAKYVVVSAWTGAFICQLNAQEKPPGLVHKNRLTAPNSFPFPTRSQYQVIPPDSGRVLVGIGHANGNVVLREQFWHLAPDSYMLAPSSKHVISTSKTHGVRETNETQSTMATSLGLSASGGWGPVSASLSAALNETSSSSQQVSISLEETRYETIEQTNASKDAVMYLKWQLIDVFTVFGKDPKRAEAGIVPLCSASIYQTPTLVDAPYNLTQVTSYNGTRHWPG